MEKVNILVVTDAQVDFHNGALGTKEAQASVPAIVKKSKHLETRAMREKQTLDCIWTIISNVWNLQGTMAAILSCLPEHQSHNRIVSF